MGLLSHFDLARWADHHLVETGHGAGDSLRHAVMFGFPKITSIEIKGEHLDHGRAEFASDPRVLFIEGDSGAVLTEFLEDIPTDQPILFWLDAHYCDGTQDVVFPLAREMGAILATRAAGIDTIVIDDVKTGEIGGVAAEWAARFEATHSITRDDADEGYLILKPKPIASVTISNPGPGHTTSVSFNRG